MKCLERSLLVLQLIFVEGLTEPLGNFADKSLEGKLSEGWLDVGYLLLIADFTQSDS